MLLFAYVMLNICCHSVNDDKTNADLLKKFDSINMELKAINEALKEERQKKITITDSVVSKQSTIRVKKYSNNQMQPVKKNIQQPVSQMNLTDHDTVFYYYKSNPKHVSVAVSPWKDGKRSVQFYDPQGNITYTCQDVKMSFSLITQLKIFHENGAIAEIEIHNNPGASMYWYETYITFGINNEPEWKTDIQKPERSLEQYMHNKSFWNKSTKTWVKQEIAKETLTPPTK